MECFCQFTVSHTVFRSFTEVLGFNHRTIAFLTADRTRINVYFSQICSIFQSKWNNHVLFVYYVTFYDYSSRHLFGLIIIPLRVQECNRHKKYLFCLGRQKRFLCWWRRGESLLAAARSRRGSDAAPRRHSPPRRVLLPPHNSIKENKASETPCFLSGGGGGSRTPVRKPVGRIFSERSHCFRIPLARRSVTGSALR